MIDSTDDVLAQRGFSRRQVLRTGTALGVGGALASFLAACGSSSSSGSSGAASGGLTSVALQFCYLKNVQFAGSFFATTKGYYKAAGLNVTLLAGGPSLAPEPIVVSGKALAGISHTAEVIGAINNGADIKVIGAGFQKNPTCIASLASKPIKTPTDMYGKKIGISDTNAPIWNSFVKANNLDVSKITVVTVGFDVTSLASGEIDGLMAFAANEPAILKTKGVDTYVLLLSDFHYPLMEDLYIARTSDLADATKKKALVGLMKGESLGWADVVADPDGAANLAVTNFGKDLKLDAAQQKVDAGLQNAFVADADTKAHGLFWMTDEKIAGTIASLGLGGVKASKDMFTNEVLQEVYQGGSVPA
ncbi:MULTISPECIES: ABC transporter substrate-binding protein [unclassified Frankia]|uniref:ABC transporter substrate-binding protein n=1 Tax=unclassified Frankia TaxID=2632575 RepID=UPI0019320B26|nr:MULTISPECIES: ABC transporter substrate-binding protein [unclassified Frankia]MBL7623597.1 ABC transporter substrate-binding protein [Frankia sp. AgB1.8]